MKTRAKIIVLGVEGFGRRRTGTNSLTMQLLVIPFVEIGPLLYLLIAPMSHTAWPNLSFWGEGRDLRVDGTELCSWVPGNHDVGSVEQISGRLMMEMI